jgi:peptidoglycan/LPS O-acetylase OafA/YrhL
MGSRTKARNAKPFRTEKTGTSFSERSYIPTLDGWRALAVSLVIGTHSYTMLMNNGSSVARSLASLFSHAGYGVDVFFALSGYLICTLLLREKERTGTINISRFYVRRAFRILPPVLLFLVSIVFLSRVRMLPRFDMREVMAVLFFYRNYVFGSWYTGHFWSLAVEEQFYAVIPLFLLLANRRWAVRCALLLIAFCIGIRWIEFSSGMFFGSLLQFRTENRFDGLLWGSLLALALHDPLACTWLRARLTGWVFLAAIVFAAVLLSEFTTQPARRTIVAVVMPILIGHTVLHSGSLAGRFLEFPLLKWIGRVSYSLYIWQMLFLVEGSRPLGPLQAFPLNLICPFICAALSYYLLEKPMIKLGHRLAGSPGAAAVNYRQSANAGLSERRRQSAPG